MSLSHADWKWQYFGLPPPILLLPVPTLHLTAQPHWNKCPCLFHTYLPYYFKLPSDTQISCGHLFKKRKKKKYWCCLTKLEFICLALLKTKTSEMGNLILNYMWMLNSRCLFWENLALCCFKSHNYTRLPGGYYLCHFNCYLFYLISFFLCTALLCD